MKFLLDTNVVSEWMKAPPNAKVVRWLADVDEDRTYLSVLTFAEIWQGIELMAAGNRRDVLISWVENDLPMRFEGRVLTVTLAVAQNWGSLMVKSKKAGGNMGAMGAMDALIAATARTHDLTLVTRNTKHFDGLDLALANPWRD